ncbi:MAG: DUF5915 domain-containing protein, partial [Nocardioidaceae bacterium]
SRRRFWKGDPAAHATLHETLETLTRLLAPIVPFITERVWQDVVRPTDPGVPSSVHLSAWPDADESRVVAGLGDQVALARRVTELGRSARAEAKVRTRQPLRRALIGSAAWARLGPELRAEVCDELNIGALESLAEAGGGLVDYRAKGNFRNLGSRFAKRTPAVAAAIAACDAEALATALQQDGTAMVDVDGEPVTVSADDVIISERPREGWSVVNDQGETVALDLELSDDLVRAGLAREAIRFIQDARKSSGLEVSDRIELSWSAAGELAEALRTHGPEVAEEVLAVEFDEMPADAPRTGALSDDDLGLTVTLARV